MPLVTAQLLIKSGGEVDPSDMAGVADMTASLLTQRHDHAERDPDRGNHRSAGRHAELGRELGFILSHDQRDVVAHRTGDGDSL